MVLFLAVHTFQQKMSQIPGRTPEINVPRFSDLRIDSDAEDMEPRTLAKQWGCTVTQIEPDVVLKWGCKVRPNEEAAIRLVREHAPSVPVPQVYHSWFGVVDGLAAGQLYMSLMPGECLTSV